MGDALRPRTGLGFLGLGGRLSSRWAVGAYVVEPQGVRLESARTVSPAAVTDAGEVQGTLTEAGVSAAWRPASRLHLGIRLRPRGSHWKAAIGFNPQAALRFSKSRLKAGLPASPPASAFSTRRAPG